MARRDTVLRSMHDVGLAVWFGGSLMGAVGLDGATSQADSPAERSRLSAAGWTLWSPVAAGAIALHAAGAAGLVLSSPRREGRADAAVKASLTVLAAGLSAYGGVLGQQVELPRHEDGSEELARAQKQLRAIHWAVPALSGLVVVLGAQREPPAGEG